MKNLLKGKKQGRPSWVAFFAMIGVITPLLLGAPPAISQTLAERQAQAIAASEKNLDNKKLEPWQKIRKDGIHDPRSPASRVLQEPDEALRAIYAQSPDPSIGNQVRWAKAIEDGVVKPRSYLAKKSKMQVLDQDIYLNIRGGMPVVKFPHKAHTLWLGCENCHDHLFTQKAGENPISMLQILEGEQCGVCHGAVAFPLTECFRCHSIPQTHFPEIEAQLKLKRFGPKGKVATVENPPPVVELP